MNKKIKRKGQIMNRGYMLQPVISKGIELLGRGDALSEEMLSIWEDYADSILGLICTSIGQQVYHMQYTNLRICQSITIKPNERLNQLLNYLIRIQSMF